MCPPAEWRRSVTCQKTWCYLFFRHLKVKKMFSPCKAHVSSGSMRHAHADKNAADKQRRICTIGTCILFYALKNKPSETFLGHTARTTFQGLYSSNVQSLWMSKVDQFSHKLLWGRGTMWCPSFCDRHWQHVQIPKSLPFLNWEEERWPRQGGPPKENGYNDIEIE